MNPVQGAPLSAIQLVAIGTGILVGNITILTAVTALAWRLIRAEVMELIQKVRDEISVMLRESREEAIRLKLLSESHEEEIEKLRKARHDMLEKITAPILENRMKLDEHDREIEKLGSRVYRLEDARFGSNGK